MSGHRRRRTSDHRGAAGGPNRARHHATAEPGRTRNDAGGACTRRTGAGDDVGIVGVLRALAPGGIRCCVDTLRRTKRSAVILLGFAQRKAELLNVCTALMPDYDPMLVNQLPKNPVYAPCSTRSPVGASCPFLHCCRWIECLHRALPTGAGLRPVMSRPRRNARRRTGVQALAYFPHRMLPPGVCATRGDAHE
jgi:hypothetical protein